MISQINFFPDGTLESVVMDNKKISYSEFTQFHDDSILDITYDLITFINKKYETMGN